MAEAITFDGPLGVTIGYLNGEFDDRGMGVEARPDVPNPRPSRFVRALHTGGIRRNLAQSDAQITLECWGHDEVAAEQLAIDTYGLMSAMDTDTAYVPIGPAGVVGEPVPLPDPDSGSPRYVFTRIVRLRARTL